MAEEEDAFHPMVEWAYRVKHYWTYGKGSLNSWLTAGDWARCYPDLHKNVVPEFARVNMCAMA